MNINKINANIITPNFNGVKNSRKETKNENNTTVPVFVNVSSDKLTSALKAAVLIPAASLPLILGSCDKADHCDEYWTVPGNGSSITYPSIHILPEFKVDSLTFANDTVRIPEKLSSTSKINLTINNMFDALNVPRLGDGTIPAALTFQTDKYIQFMKLDGMASAATDNEKFYYDVQRYKNDGKFDSFKLEFSNDGDDLVMRPIGLNKNDTEYVFSANDNVVNSYQSINGMLVPVAKYEQGDTRDYTIQQTQETGDSVQFRNINAFFVKSDFEK